MKRRPIDPYDDRFSDVYFCCSMPGEREIARANRAWLRGVVNLEPMRGCRL